MQAIEEEEGARAVASRVRRAVQPMVAVPAMAGMLDRAKIDLAGCRILDVGCGSGYEALLLIAEFAPAELVGFDASSERIAAAQAMGVPGASLSVGDIGAIDALDGSFDAAFVIDVLQHVPCWRSALAEIGRVLKPEGVLCIGEANARALALEERVRLGQPTPTDTPHFDWDQLQTGLEETGFRVVDRENLVGPLVRSYVCTYGSAAVSQRRVSRRKKVGRVKRPVRATASQPALAPPTAVEAGPGRRATRRRR